MSESQSQTQPQQPAQKYSCILLAGDHEHLSSAAETFARKLFDVRHVSRYPRDAKHLAAEVTDLTRGGEVDFLFNYLSPVIVPERILQTIRRAAVNFHPAPPEWPGVGSASYALYEGDETFGVTAHVMTPKVDAGPIVRSIRFPVLADDDCESLFGRALNFSLFLFYDVLAEVARGGAAQPSGDAWKRGAVRRAEFEKWMAVKPSDSADEVRRKIRALRHSRLPGPYVEVGGLKFHLPAGAPLPRAVTKLAQGKAA
jgi:methionyl-tRNA formyltransferase